MYQIRTRKNKTQLRTIGACLTEKDGDYPTVETLSDLHDYLEQEGFPSENAKETLMKILKAKGKWVTI
jgi:hypothetical protein